MFQKIKVATAALAGAGLWAISGTASAIPLNTCHTGDCGGGNVTVANITLTQEGATTVGFTLENYVNNLSNSNDSTFIGYFRFNYTGDARTLSFSNITALNTSTVTGIVQETIKNNGDLANDANLEFDAMLNLPTSNNDPNRFTNGESVYWTASISSGLSVNDFVNPMMVHIQSLNNGESAKYIAAPAPAAAALVGLGLIGFATAGRLKKKA